MGETGDAVVGVAEMKGDIRGTRVNGSVNSADVSEQVIQEGNEG